MTEDMDPMKREMEFSEFMEKQNQLLLRVSQLITVLIVVFVAFVLVSIWQSCSVQYVVVIDDTAKVLDSD